MFKTKSGFTIVELLIVIVVIAILAAISIVAYNGIQSRARDNVRYNDAKAIIKALELYKVDKGVYPPTSATTTSGIPAISGCGPINANGYSYSWATDGTWLKPLVDGGYLPKAPIPPVNDCSHSYSYLNVSKANSTVYNCPSRTKGYYILQVENADGSLTPSDAASPNWTPCTGSNVAWGGTAKYWAFGKDEE